VARFYLERDKPKATIIRLEALLKKYPDAGVDPEVMLLLGQTYLKLEQKQQAQTTFANLIKRYPKDANSAKAKLYLKYMAGQRD
jgi:TolA-binding protein